MTVMDIEALKRWAREMLIPVSDLGGPFCMTNYSAQELGRQIMQLIGSRESILNLACELRKDLMELEATAEKVSKHCAELIQERDSIKEDWKALAAERDSLKALHEKEAAGLSGLLVEIQKERDSLAQKLGRLDADWDRMVKDHSQLRSERDELRGKIAGAAEMQREYLKRAELAQKERDSLREKYEKALTLRDRVIVEIQEVKKERDSLKSANACLGSEVEQWKRTAIGYKAKADERDSLRDQLKGPLVQFALELDRMNAEAAKAMGGVA